jgi:hypothetical protein
MLCNSDVTIDHSDFVAILRRDTRLIETASCWHGTRGFLIASLYTQEASWISTQVGAALLCEHHGTLRAMEMLRNLKYHNPAE